jgi:hypothetical protein
MHALDATRAGRGIAWWHQEPLYWESSDIHVYSVSRFWLICANSSPSAVVRLQSLTQKIAECTYRAHAFSGPRLFRLSRCSLRQLSTSGPRRALHAKAGAGRREQLEPKITQFHISRQASLGSASLRRFNPEHAQESLLWSEVRLKGARFEVAYFSRAVSKLDEDGFGKPLSFSKEEDSIPAERAVSAGSDIELSEPPTMF